MEVGNSVYPALLALEDGSIFPGKAIQPKGVACGEVVFNSAITGYQEILTDPSYAGQMITFTYPHIGNVGVNEIDNESDKIWAQGIIVRSLTMHPSNWRAEKSLAQFLLEKQIVMIGEVDTRALTQKIRSMGTLKGCIMVGGEKDQALKLAREFTILEQKNWVQCVSSPIAYEWEETSGGIKSPHVIVYDFGVKRSILRTLAQLGCKLHVVPANTDPKEILKLSPDGIVLSNGPGDPALCSTQIKMVQQLLQHSIPILGICLGHQLLGLALGAKTTKMKFGHHGANHPVQCLKTKKVFITSQNHNFMIDENTLPPEMVLTHRSLFDDSLQGMCHRSKPLWGFQGHPEAGPGPNEAKMIFGDFIQASHQFQKAKSTARDTVYA